MASGCCCRRCCTHSGCLRHFSGRLMNKHEGKREDEGGASVFSRRPRRRLEYQSNTTPRSAAAAAAYTDRPLHVPYNDSTHFNSQLSTELVLGNGFVFTPPTYQLTGNTANSLIIWGFQCSRIAQGTADCQESRSLVQSTEGSAYRRGVRGRASVSLVVVGPEGSAK